MVSHFPDLQKFQEFCRRDQNPQDPGSLSIWREIGMARYDGNERSILQDLSAVSGDRQLQRWHPRPRIAKTL